MISAPVGYVKTKSNVWRRIQTDVYKKRSLWSSGSLANWERAANVAVVSGARSQLPAHNARGELFWKTTRDTVRFIG